MHIIFIIVVSAILIRWLFVSPVSFFAALGFFVIAATVACAVILAPTHEEKVATCFTEMTKTPTATWQDSAAQVNTADAACANH